MGYWIDVICGVRSEECGKRVRYKPGRTLGEKRVKRVVFWSITLIIWKSTGGPYTHRSGQSCKFDLKSTLR